MQLLHRFKKPTSWSKLRRSLEGFFQWLESIIRDLWLLFGNNPHQYRLIRSCCTVDILLTVYFPCIFRGRGTEWIPEDQSYNSWILKILLLWLPSKIEKNVKCLCLCTCCIELGSLRAFQRLKHESVLFKTKLWHSCCYI